MDSQNPQITLETKAGWTHMTQQHHLWEWGRGGPDRRAARGGFRCIYKCFHYLTVSGKNVKRVAFIYSKWLATHICTLLFVSVISHILKSK